MIKIRLISDLHLEYRKENYCISPIESLNEDDVSICILAGDIGHPFENISLNQINNSFHRPINRYEKLLVDARSKFDYVLVLAGNHEYYDYRHQNRNPKKDLSLSIDDIDQYLENLCQQLGCIYLNQKSILFSNSDSIIKIVGATYWSKIPSKTFNLAKSRNNDFKNISYRGRKYHPADYNQLHYRDRNFIESELKHSDFNSIPTIVVTHHCPSYQVTPPKFWNDPLNVCYASESEYLFQSPLIAWLCGHSHYNHDIKINQIPVYLNCRGHPKEKTGFDHHYTLLLPF